MGLDTAILFVLLLTVLNFNMSAMSKERVIQSHIVDIKIDCLFSSNMLISDIFLLNFAGIYTFVSLIPVSECQRK